MARYAMKTLVKGTFEEVKTQVTEALKAQGFGILTQIDVQQTLREKIGAEMEPYQILGSCNPNLAHRALNIDRSMGLLLPCNVVLRGVEEGIEVSIQDPQAMFAVAEPEVQSQLQPLAQEAKSRLEQALSGLAQGAKPS